MIYAFCGQSIIALVIIQSVSLTRLIGVGSLSQLKIVLRCTPTSFAISVLVLRLSLGSANNSIIPPINYSS
jgi:hypothetical protein